MRVSRGFIRVFLLILLLFIALNIISAVIGFYNVWIIIVLILLILGLIVIIFRKKPSTITKVFAYGIPLIIVLYLLYFNFVPLHEIYKLDVGTSTDSDESTELYIVESKELSERLFSNDKTFRFQNDSGEVVFKPKTIVENKAIKLEIESDGVYFINYSQEDLPSFDWQYIWNFKYAEPIHMYGDAKINQEKNCLYFNGKSKKVLNNTKDEFEKGPFTVYVEWLPEENNKSFQQLIGHMNWELSQEKNSVRFSIGKTIPDEKFFSIAKIIKKDDFFGKKHVVVAIYNPGENGYIELFVDGDYSNRLYIGNNVMSEEYGGRDLSFGKTGHGNSDFFQGCLYEAKFSNQAYFPYSKTKVITSKNNSDLRVPIFGVGNIYSISATI